jgi:hypothetical protein
MGIINMRRPIRKRHIGNSASLKAGYVNDATTCDMADYTENNNGVGGDQDEKTRVNQLCTH